MDQPVFLLSTIAEEAGSHCIHWLTAIAALVGVWLNIRRCVVCFYIWAVTNAMWMYIDVVHGIYAQGVLQGIYFGLSLYGIVQWTKRPVDALS